MTMKTPTKKKRTTRSKAKSHRSRIELDGPWQFLFDSDRSVTLDRLDEIDGWRTAQTPMPWQAQFDDLRLASGTAWYRRAIPLDAAPAGAAILHFGAVDYLATVWVNGQLIGEHEGGYLPFEFDVAAHLQAGENEIVVRAVDPSDDEAAWPGFPFGEIPHGKQSWYGPIGGIWQSVWLELRPRLHLRRLMLTPDAASGVINVAVTFGDTQPGDEAQVQVHVYAPNGVEVGAGLLDATGRGRVPVTGDLHLWSPETPALYRVSAVLLVKNKVADEIHDHCGFRTVEAREGRIYLNGKPIYLRGALDQAYYPESIYTVPSMAFLEEQIEKAKALGLNCLRCHIKVEDPRYYEAADRLGILIWTEIPNWVHLSAQAAQRAKATFIGMVERDWNHPSIIAWTLINENWGTDLVRNEEHRRWLADFYHAAKAIDPTRLIVDNSACCDNFHVAGDLDDFHHYRAIPDHAEAWDQWVADFAGRAAWSWAEDFAHERRQGLPLIVSEFGNWGLPHPQQIQEKGRDPWWFETGLEWGDGVVYPHGMAQRFQFWGLHDVFGSLDQFVQQHQLHMAHSLAYEIATMRMHPAIAGYVITEFTDVHWECNGLMDMQRHVKAGLPEIFAPLNQDKVVVARPLRWSGKPGESLAVSVQAFSVEGPDSQGVIRWQAGTAQGELSAPGGVVQVPLAAPGKVPLVVEWLAAEGNRIAHFQVELTCVAPYVAPQPLFTGADRDLAEALLMLGYNVTTGDEAETALWVTRAFSAENRAAVQQGAHMLVLAGEEATTATNTVSLPVGRVVARAGGPWQGDWATSYSWLKKQGPFAHLPGDPLLGMEYAPVMPGNVITGIPAWAFARRSWAGLALGWVHKPASLLAQARYGRGSLTATTFRLSPELLTSDAIAQALFGGMVELARR
jgi:hypothetical protein